MRNIKTFVLAVVIIMFGASFVPVTKAPSPVKAAAFTNYVWYYDQDCTQAVGYTSDIDVEIGRLRYIYPLNVFSSDWSMSLHAYEYGDRPYQLPIIIYSDLY